MIGKTALGLVVLATSTQAANKVDVASHVIYSYSGPSLPSDLVSYTKQGLVGGVILFGENVQGANVQSNMATLQSAYKSSPAYQGHPLLIFTDQEGGEVKRVPGGPNQSEKEIGEASDPGSAATDAGYQAASALRQYSLNGNLAPVLDVFRTPGDFEDQYERSYSNNPSVVADCGNSFIQAQQSRKVLATAKHFPGLGAAKASENTDAKPVTLNLSLDEIRRVDEAPYTSAISAGVKLVMMSWARYTGMDSTTPAGLSSAWIGELRNRLGFKGVTITDAIEAGALSAYGADTNRAVLASKAGMDLILAGARNVTQGRAIVDALASALDSGKLSSSSFSAASSRIRAMQATL